MNLKLIKIYSDNIILDITKFIQTSKYLYLYLIYLNTLSTFKPQVRTEIYFCKTKTKSGMNSRIFTNFSKKLDLNFYQTV